jgi:hypothetical protein
MIEGSAASKDEFLVIPDWTKPPYTEFAPPGAIAISADAMRLAHECASALAAEKSYVPHIVAFAWAERMIRRFIESPPGGLGPREELGPGPALMSFERATFPPDTIQIDGDLEFAVKIPRRIWLAIDRPYIDVVEMISNHGILRLGSAEQR